MKCFMSELRGGYKMIGFCIESITVIDKGCPHAASNLSYAPLISGTAKTQNSAPKAHWGKESSELIASELRIFIKLLFLSIYAI